MDNERKKGMGMLENWRNMMKAGMCVLLALCGLLVAGCSKEVSDKRGASETAAKSKEKTSREVIRARKVIEEVLERRGWFERKAVSPTSGKKIKVLFCAIRLADIARMRLL